MLVALLIVVGLAVSAKAERLVDSYTVMGEARHFFNWIEIQKAWQELHTYEALIAEYDKVRAVYEPWRSLYKQNRKEALLALETSPDRAAIERGHDLQRAFEHWETEEYYLWRSLFSGSRGRTGHFEDWVESARKRDMGWRPGIGCLTDLPGRQYDLETLCGNRPDWRSPKRRASDQALYDKHAERHAEWLKEEEEEAARRAASGRREGL